MRTGGRMVTEDGRVVGRKVKAGVRRWMVGGWRVVGGGMVGWGKAKACERRVKAGGKKM